MSLQNKIENAIPHDKLLHFTLGLLLALPALLYCWLIFLPVLVGLVKELLDKYVRKTGFDWWDILATSLPVFPVLLVIIIKDII